MRCLFLVVFVYAVRCQDGNYYVIQVPRNEPQRSLKVYWNVPTMQCRSKKIPFEDLYQKYGIHQNAGDQFRGEEVTIMYDPGLFPALLKNETSGKFKFRNGGVPQEGDLDKHLEAFRKDLDLSIPDLGFKGIGIIDFESWRPIFRQNFGVLSPYKDVSYEIERKLHWWWPKSSIEAEAKRRFESSARVFMEETISLARQLRPGGVWGFYGFPYCFNMASNNMVEGCAKNVPEENDRLSWLWQSSTALYPSLYSSASLSTSQLTALVRGRVREARRVRRGVVLPYFWYRYRDGGFLTQTDLNAALNELYKSNASGFIIWGSSSDVNTVDKCKKLYDYIENIFGPAVAKYTKTSFRDEVIDGNNNTTIEKNYTELNNNSTTDLSNRTEEEDPNLSDKIHIVDKLNNTDILNSTDDIKNSIHDNKNGTDDIIKDIEKEIIKKFTNYVPINEDNTSEEEEAVLKNNNVLIDLIINSILNKEFNSLSYQNNNNESTYEYNLTYATTESSLSTSNNAENNNTIDKNNNFTSEKQITIDENIARTTESTKVTSNDDIETINHNYNESHKETTQIDIITNYNLGNDTLFESRLKENDSTTETAVINSIYGARAFNFNSIDGTYLNFDILRTGFNIIDSTTTQSTKTISELENKPDDFLDSETFNVYEITTTENVLDKNKKINIFTRDKSDIDLNESELNETENEYTDETEFKETNKENELSETIHQIDVRIESIYSSTTESQNINILPNSVVTNQGTTRNYIDYDGTLTTSTETATYYTVFDETTVAPTINIIKDESETLIEDNTSILNSEETINNFDNNGTKAESEISIGDSTAVVNTQETIDYTVFDETTATSITSPKAESSSIEESTAVSTIEDKVVVYIL